MTQISQEKKMHLHLLALLWLSFQFIIERVSSTRNP